MTEEEKRLFIISLASSSQCLVLAIVNLLIFVVMMVKQHTGAATIYPDHS